MASKSVFFGLIVVLLMTTCFHVIFGAALFQSFNDIPDFIAEKVDGKTRTILLRFGRVYGIQTVVGINDEESHVITITTNGLVLSKTDSTTELVSGHKTSLDTAEECFISADKETVEEFLYVFDSKFRTIDSTGVVFLMEIPESELSDVSDESMLESSSGSHGGSDTFASESSDASKSKSSDTSAPESTASGVTIKPTNNAVWEEWNLRHGITNQIPIHLQNTFDTLLAVTDHCVLTEDQWKHVHTKFTKEGFEPESPADLTKDVNEPNRARRTPGIYPGTLWCGLGDAATSFDAFGEHADTDKCCREHDFCPSCIGPFSSNYGYFNLRPYSINHCDCDTRLVAVTRFKVISEM